MPFRVNGVKVVKLAPAVKKELVRAFKDSQENLEKFIIDAAQGVKAEATLNTPVWNRKQSDKKSGWNKIRAKRGDVSGHAKNSWEIEKRKTADKFIVRVFNNVPYIKLLEFGGFGGPNSWGNYKGKATPRTQPTGAADPKMNSNVSKQAPRGMLRLAVKRMAVKIRAKFGG
jgi:Bacteriophage HK97-gp10, putative tail-component